MSRTSRRARRSSPLFLPSAFDLFTPSKELVLKNIWIFGPLYAVPLIFWIHSWIWSPLPNQHVTWWHSGDGFSIGWPGGPLPTYSTFLLVGFSFLWLLIIMAVGTIAQIMSQAAQLDAAEGRRLDFAVLWATVRELGWRLLGLYIIVGISVVVGLFLLVVPGIILIRRYFLAPYVMLDKKLGILDSMQKSTDLSKVNPGSIWGVLGVMLLIGMINIVPIIGGFVSFIIGSLYSIAPALRYQQIKRLAAR